MAKRTKRPRWDDAAAKVPRELGEAFKGFRNPARVESRREHLWRLYPDAPPFAGAASVDWRTGGAVPTPGYQGACNTCTSFAVVTAAESLHYLKTGVKIRLATGFVHVCLLGRSCQQGASAEEVLDEAAAHGIAYGFPGDYPYPQNLCATGNLFSVRQRQWLPGPNEGMNAIAMQGPVVGDMWIDPEFLHVGPADVYRYQETPSRRLHSVAIIGYDQPQGYWIVSNSFGTQWGDGGFGRVAFGSGGLLSDRGGWQLIL